MDTDGGMDTGGSTDPGDTTDPGDGTDPGGVDDGDSTIPPGSTAIGSIGDLKVAVGSKLSLVLAGAELISDSVRFLASPLPLPDNTVLDTVSGAFTFTPDVSQVGSFMLTLSDARRLVGKYVAHYNDVRRHSAIAFVIPTDRPHGRDEALFAERDRKLAGARESRRQCRRSVRNRQPTRDRQAFHGGKAAQANTKTVGALCLRSSAASSCIPGFRLTSYRNVP